MPMRRGGVVGTVARTAAIAGTATVVNRGVNNMMDNRAQNKYEEQAAQQAAFQNQQDMASMQQQLQQMQAQQAAASAAPAPASNDLLAQLERLSRLKETGVLSQAEFDAAKAKLLAA
jgi:hypothetical protein